MAKSPRAKRWRIECTAAKRYLAHARTGERGVMTSVGTFGSVDAAVQACEDAIARGPVRPGQRKAKALSPQPSIAERVQGIVGGVQPPPPPEAAASERAPEETYPWL
jgi:hypothetical protein